MENKFQSCLSFSLVCKWHCAALFVELVSILYIRPIMQTVRNNSWLPAIARSFCNSLRIFVPLQLNTTKFYVSNLYSVDPELEMSQVYNS